MASCGSSPPIVARAAVLEGVLSAGLITHKSNHKYLGTRGDRIFMYGCGLPRGSVFGHWISHTIDAQGFGRSQDPEMAKLLAEAETLERYASMACTSAQVTVASPQELGDSALDLDAIPRFSESELAHASRDQLVRPPTIVRPPTSEQIRWVSGVDVHTTAAIYLPAVMVYIGIPPWPSERFWLQISTGCAAHDTLHGALVNGICEVAERDALSITWLQKLPLPRIETDSLPPQTQRLLDFCRGEYLETHLFDATTDLGIPTVYCLQVAPNIDVGSQTVGCAASLDVASAAEKAILEAFCTRISLRQMPKVVKSAEDCTGLLDSACFLSLAENRGAFDFLLTQGRTVPARAGEPDATDMGLASLLHRLREHGMHVLAVDLTTDEIIPTGLNVVRVIIPELQPFSLSFPAQYRGHRRLYSAPLLMGYSARPERDLNLWPQPFG